MNSWESRKHTPKVGTQTWERYKWMWWLGQKRSLEVGGDITCLIASEMAWPESKNTQKTDTFAVTREAQVRIEIGPGSPSLGVECLRHWTTVEVSPYYFFSLHFWLCPFWLLHLTAAIMLSLEEIDTRAFSMVYEVFLFVIDTLEKFI